jgi:hypothetical protein
MLSGQFRAAALRMEEREAVPDDREILSKMVAEYQRDPEG